MTTKNIFAGMGVRTTFVNILYDELMKREFVTLADIMCIKRRLPKGFYDNNPKATLSKEMYYGDLKKASSEVVKALEQVSPGCVEDNGKTGKGKAFKYSGKSDDPLAAERQAIEQKRIEDYVAFCKASAGILPYSWFSSYFENIIGVTHEKGAKVEEVVIRTKSEYQHGLLLTKPLHHSLEETIPFGEHDGQWYGEVKLAIEPNRELRGRILMYGENLEVMQPLRLREQIKEILTKQLENYNDIKE